MHELVLDAIALSPEEGMILGNGDLSVSVYQAEDEIRFRLGKGDVWDRRLDLSRDPRPAHIREVARGIVEEGWKCGPYGGPVEATKGSADPDRMREICKGCPPSSLDYPFPCPKPVAELALRFPGDLTGMKISQRLLIEEACLELSCRWKNGVSLNVACVVHPEENRLALHWEVAGWDAARRYEPSFHAPAPSPVWFALYRQADEGVEAFGRRHFSTSRHPGFLGFAAGRGRPLSPPSVARLEGSAVVVQHFPEDSLFKDGFALAVAVQATGFEVTAVTGAPDEAVLHLLPTGPGACSGELSVGVATTGDLPEERRNNAGGMAEAGLALALSRASAFAADRDSSLAAAAAFWAKSEIRLADAFLDTLWHATLHVKRCVLRAGKTPPGLFLPSTVCDYSLWHGDYHANYNLQSIFLGDYAANHLELGDAYFDGMAYFLKIGRKIARDYYGCRGAFIQLNGYPTHPDDDLGGVVPMGRMAYMTGWVAAHYFSRWRHTLDRAWLEQQGYPVVRDLALFYTDFLSLGDDGLYHAFPSNQGEEGFTGDARQYTDRAQVMRHARYCLQAALEMAAALAADASLQEEWRQRLARLAPEDGDPARQQRVTPDERFRRLAPEFLGFDGVLPPRDPDQPPAFLQPGHDFYDWYPGKIPYEWIIHLRNGAWKPVRDWLAIKALLERWVHPNGLLWAMSLANFGRVGGWTESLGITGAIQEMLLQSWSGVIELFPGWPRHLDAAFEGLRAEGAFGVTAAQQAGRVTRVEITSATDAVCVLRNPWPGEPVILRETEAPAWCPLVEGGDGLLRLSLRLGGRYQLDPANRRNGTEE